MDFCICVEYAMIFVCMHVHVVVIIVVHVVIIMIITDSADGIIANYP